MKYYLHNKYYLAGEVEVHPLNLYNRVIRASKLMIEI